MFHSKIISFFFSLLPFKIWKDYFIRHHLENCSFCQKKLASREEAKAFLVQADEVGNLDLLWPAIKEKISERKAREVRSQPFSKLRWRWAVAAASLLVAVMAGFWLYRTFKPERIQAQAEPSGRFQINYLKIEDEPANAYVFYPHDSDVIIIWAEKTF